jgi:hypothetical protein
VRATFGVSSASGPSPLVVSVPVPPPVTDSSQQVIRPAASTQMDKEIIRQLPELGRLKILFEAATQGRTDGIKLVRTALESFAHAP